MPRRSAPRNDLPAFTLAEVLITLGVIGIVAALTLPSVISNTQNNAKAQRIKKVYSVIQQATNKSIFDNGDVTDWYNEAAYSSGFSASLEIFERVVKPYYNIAQLCVSGSNNASGFRVCGYKDEYIYTLNGIIVMEVSRLKIPIVLSDGSVLIFRPVKSNLSKDESKPVWGYYWTVYYDDNGPKPPNKLGKDVFVFDISPFLNKVVPNGLYSSISDSVLKSYSNIKNECLNSLGMSCAALIMLDDWKIKY